MTTIKINDRLFKKSSFSPIKFVGNPICVAVSISDQDVLVTNTKNPERVLKFTPEEWKAFVAGVKNNEFDF